MSAEFALLRSPAVCWLDPDIEKPPACLIVNAQVDQRIIRCYFDIKRKGWFDLADRRVDVKRWKKIIHIDNVE